MGIYVYTHILFLWKTLIDTKYDSDFAKTKLKKYRDTSQLTMRLHPDKLIINENILSQKHT